VDITIFWIAIRARLTREGWVCIAERKYGENNAK
jgi:hypothetical protein